MRLLGKYCKNIRVFLLFIVFAVLFHLGYSFAWVNGNSMHPTYKNGEWVVVDEWTYKFFVPEKGDVILINDASHGGLLLKRIISMPGEEVTTCSWDLPYRLDTQLKTKILKKNEYWVIGDNKEDSWSGVIKLRDIRGKL
jgi:signal peptidase I